MFNALTIFREPDLLSSQFTTLDWCVLVGYFVGIIGLGLFFWRRSSSSTEEFTAGGRSLPGWLTGLSIFATYLSSISYLALPGKAFADNWNGFVFSLGLPLAAIVAVMYFVPMYRLGNDVSAYALLERRFGVWARVYGSAFYLLFQIARIGMVMYLMALPMAVIFGWDIRVIIVITGFVVTLYSFIGGIVAVIWADAIQAIVLLVGAVVALYVILHGMPGGPAQVFEIAEQGDKFSLGSFEWKTVSKPTVWILLAFGFFENLKNFGIDQSFIQRYIASKSSAQARGGVWLSVALYVPVSALFFFIGTSLYGYYQTHTGDVTEIREIVARQRLMQAGETSITADKITAVASTLTDKDIGDRVFPHFIAKHLPSGVTGLLIAAIFAAAMSTVSTSLNSSATLVMSDFYQRFVSPHADDRQLMRVLYFGTVMWGVMGTAMAIWLVRLTDSALDIWWTLSSVLGSGLLGLFMLGMLCRNVRNREAIIGVLVGTCLIGWMAISPTTLWPEAWSDFVSPFHANLVIVIGCISIVLTGDFLAKRN